MEKKQENFRSRDCSSHWTGLGVADYNRTSEAFE